MGRDYQELVLNQKNYVVLTMNTMEIVIQVVHQELRQVQIKNAQI